MLRIPSIFNGLQSIACQSDVGVDIHIEAVRNTDGSIKEVKWLVNNAHFQDEDSNIFEYICGIYRDTEPESCSIYDNTGRFPRLIAKRDISAMKHVPQFHRVKSAFQKIMEILELYHPYIDDNVIDFLTDQTITKGKTGIGLQFLKEIPDSVDQQHLVDDFNRQCYVKGKHRYWQKVLILNRRRFWITNHVFHYSVPKFLELMIDITGIEFPASKLEDIINNASEEQLKNDKEVKLDVNNDNDIDANANVNDSDSNNIAKNDINTDDSIDEIEDDIDEEDIDEEIEDDINDDIDIDEVEDEVNDDNEDKINKEFSENTGYSFKNDTNNNYTRKEDQKVQSVNIEDLLSTSFGL